MFSCLIQRTSKGKVLAVLDQKIQGLEVESESLKKAYYKGQGAAKDFVEQLLEKRIAFHKYQILKVKVNAQ